MRLFTFVLVILSTILTSCAKEEPSVEIIQDKEIELQMIDAYEEGLKALEERDA